LHFFTRGLRTLFDLRGVAADSRIAGVSEHRPSTPSWSVSSRPVHRTAHSLGNLVRHLLSFFSFPSLLLNDRISYRPWFNVVEIVAEIVAALATHSSECFALYTCLFLLLALVVGYVVITTRASRTPCHRRAQALSILDVRKC